MLTRVQQQQQLAPFLWPALCVVLFWLCNYNVAEYFSRGYGGGGVLEIALDLQQTHISVDPIFYLCFSFISNAALLIVVFPLVLFFFHASQIYMQIVQLFFFAICFVFLLLFRGLVM